MNGLSLVAPPRGDRVLIAGQTGSGKTTLAEYLLRFREYVAVLDSKGLLRWPGYVVATTLRELQKLEHPRLIYRPAYAELQDGPTVDAFFQWIYERRNTTVYVDELAAISRGDEYPYHLGACLMRGRELGVDVWLATQRPTRIPQVALSESEHVYTFRLRLPQDRLKIAEVAGVDPDAVDKLPKRYFIYSPQAGTPAGPFTLRLDAVSA